MSSPEADNPPPLEDTGAAFRQENEKQRKSVIEKIDGINFRKTRLKPSITPRERAAMPLVDLVKAEHGLTHPEDIVLERMRDINQLARGLQNAHIDPEDSEETDPLYQKIETALNPEDTRSVKNFLFYNISERLLFRAWRRPPHDVPEEEIEWENKWDEYFKKNPAVFEQSRAQAIKENTRFHLSSEIKRIVNGDPVEEERVAYFLLDCNPTPADLKTDPLFQRLFEVCDRQGKDPEQILTHFNIEVKKRLEWEPYSPWLQEWSRALSATTETPESQPPAEDSFDISRAGRSAVEIEETLEDSRTLEIAKEGESRKKALNHLEALFIAKTETFPGLPDEKYTDLSLFSVLAKMDRDSAPAGSPYEKLLENYNQEIAEIADLFVAAKIRPEVQNPNDELYENLNLMLSAQDKAQVIQRAMYRIYHTIFSESHDPSDPNAGWINTWRDFFTSDIQLVKQLKWQNTKLEGQTIMGIEISELRNGEHKSDVAIVRNLLTCYINPDQFENHPFVRQLSDILGPRWDSVRRQYFQLFTPLSSSDAMLRRVDSADIVTNPLSRPESLRATFYDSWINDPRVVELRAQEATGHQPETTPAVAAPETAKTKWSEKITGLIVKSSKAIFEKVKSLNMKDAILGKGGDVFMAGLIGAAVRGLGTSDPSWGQTIALFSGGAFGAYHAFNREINNRYEAKVAKKAATGDVDAGTELTELSKENILQKEKLLKKECWKRYKALDNKDKATVLSYTLVGAFVGASVAEIGYLGMEDMYMHQDKSVIEDFFASSFYDIFNVPRPAGPGEFRGGLK